jgi:hypothetical protein
MMIFGQAFAGGALLFSRRHKVRWGREVWSFQWRIAVSWICGYFAFQLFTPVLFAFWGPVAAGQFGMSLSVCNGFASVAVSWISTKAAPFGTMIARRQFAELDSIFFRSLRQALGVAMAGALPVWILVFYLYRSHMRFSHRLVNPSTFAMLLIATTVNIAVTAEATYLRAHKQEKWLPVSIVSILLMVPSTYFLGKRFAAAGMTAGYLTIIILVSLGYGTYIFRKISKALAYRITFNLAWQNQEEIHISSAREVAIEGKALYGARETGKKTLIHMVSAWAEGKVLVLAQRKVDEESNEITAIPKLLNALE